MIEYAQADVIDSNLAPKAVSPRTNIELDKKLLAARHERKLPLAGRLEL